MITILDYGLGNVLAFVNVYKRLNIPVNIAKSKNDLVKATKLILPGVGTFDKAMEKLGQSGMLPSIEKLVVNQRMPILGICVGMQLLADKGFEGRETTGFGWISGHVEKIPIKKNIKIPHMGWNTVDFHKEHEILKNIQKDKREMIVYFVHSYQFQLTSDTNLLGSCDYGSRITALIEKDNIIGCQFHPEKSQKAGLEFINNFINWYP